MRTLRYTFVIVHAEPEPSQGLCEEAGSLTWRPCCQEPVPARWKSLNIRTAVPNGAGGTQAPALHVGSYFSCTNLQIYDINPRLEFI